MTTHTNHMRDFWRWTNFVKALPTIFENIVRVTCDASSPMVDVKGATSIEPILSLMRTMAAQTGFGNRVTIVRADNPAEHFRDYRLTDET